MPGKRNTYSIGTEDNTGKSSGDQDDPDVEVRCGLGPCRPSVLQTCNNAKVMIVVMSLLVFAQGFCVNGVFNVNVSSLERRFKLRSTQLGVVASTYDFTAAIFGIIVSYLGSGRHKPRWLAFSALCMIAASITMVIPHFSTGLYEWGEGVNSYCDLSKNVTVGVESCESSGLQDYMGVFVASQVLYGLGGSILYTVGIAYIDDSVKALISPVYMGIYYSFAALGPGVGFLVGGYFLNTYVDVDKVDVSSVTLERTDVRWVGAWWIGPIITLVMLCIAGLPLFLFGAELPAAKEVRETRISQKHNADTMKLDVTVPERPRIKSMPSVCIALLKNPPFLFTTLAGITEAMYIGGTATFLAKFVQNTFNMSSSRAGILTGAATVPGLFGGFAVGGIICRCCRFKVRGMLMLAFGSCLISALCVPLVYASCDQVKVAGVHAEYSGRSGSNTLQDSCNSACACTTTVYEASCDETGAQYFSPCFAGCTTRSKDGKVFSNCSCIAQPSAANVSSVTPGVCATECSKLIIFLLLLFATTFFTLLADVPAEQAFLRSIDENHRSFSLGANRLIIRLLGTLPGTVIYGAATDAGCLVWETECGEDTACWIYDNAIVTQNFFIVGVVIKVCSLITFFCAWWFYKPPRNTDTAIDISKETDNSDEKGKKDFVNQSYEGDATE